MSHILPELPLFEIGAPRDVAQGVPISEEVLIRAREAARALAGLARRRIEDGNDDAFEVPSEVDFIQEISGRTRLTCEAFEEDTGGRVPRRTLSVDFTGAETRFYWIDEGAHVEALSHALAALWDGSQRFSGAHQLAPLRGPGRQWQKNSHETLCKIDPDAKSHLMAASQVGILKNPAEIAADEILDIADRLREQCRKLPKSNKPRPFTAAWTPTTGTWHWWPTPAGSKIPPEEAERIRVLLKAACSDAPSKVPIWSSDEAVTFTYEQATFGTTMRWSSWVVLQPFTQYPELLPIQIKRGTSRDRMLSTLLYAWQQSAQRRDPRSTTIKTKGPGLQISGEMVHFIETIQIQGPITPSSLAIAAWYSASSRSNDPDAEARSILKSLAQPVQVIGIEALARYRTNQAL